jgi:hypothetical protein
MTCPRRVAVLSAVAMLVLCATLTSTASATTPAWIVAGSPLASGATEAIAETTTVTEVFSIKSPEWGITCTTMKLPESLIEGERTRKDKSIRMENCKLIGVPTCKIATIPLEPLTSTLEGTSGAFKLKFSPTSGTTVASLNLSSAGCGSRGIVPVSGTMSCNYPGVETEGKNHVLEFSLTSGTELKEAGEPVTLTGRDEFWLASGKSWKVA